MLQITDKSQCCGCGACVQRCPKQCIAMREDEEGFLYPLVNTALCIDCGLCEKVCPVLNQGESRSPLHVFAAKNRNEQQRLRSSSGGIFILLAEHVIGQGGVVFGARFDADWEVEHGYAETIEELAPLMRSKYVQSRPGNAYSEAERFLKAGRLVLYAGTSCQIAGLRRFLRKDYDNLFAVDIICHGVPSPGLWRRYLKDLSGPKVSSVITEINFREKQPGGYSWKRYGFVVRGDGGEVLTSTAFRQNVFMGAFLSNLTLRPSCYDCPAKAGKSGSDLTIADFWGIAEKYPEFDDDKGVGLVFVHTEKGKKMLSTVNAEYFEADYADAVSGNPSYHESSSVPLVRRKFWEQIYSGETLAYAYRKVTKPTLFSLVKAKLQFEMKKFTGR